MKASDYIVKRLSEQGVSKFFGYIGGMITHLADSLYLAESVEMVNTISEQGAGFSAEGYARTTGNISVAIATSGPGATNLLTPIASCFFDSTPVLFITGQVNTFEYKKYPNIRQCGFQETNIVDMAKPVTKYAVMIDKIENLRYELEKALYLMTSGRKGPVLLDLPMDIQRQEFDFELAKSFIPEDEICGLSLDDISFIKEALNSAKRPLILLGNGVRLSGSVDILNQFVLETNIPVVQSLLAVDIVSSAYPYNLGMIGTYGNRTANLMMSNADVLLVLGTRLDVRQIGAKLDTLFDNTKIIQIDIDENELDCSLVKKHIFKSDVKAFLAKMLESKMSLNIVDWQKKIIALREKYSTTKNLENQCLIPNKIIEKITSKLKSDDVVCGDVGQHQMWIGQSIVVYDKTRFISSGGLGCMGFALPCGVGVAVAGKRAIVISGDGGFQMNIQELEVIKRRNLPVKIIVMNNNSLGMVRGFQELYFENRFASTMDDYSAPDFVKISEAYGIKAFEVDAEKINDDFIELFLSDNSPALLNIYIDRFSQVEPKAIFGNSIDNMSPKLSDDEIKRIKNE